MPQPRKHDSNALKQAAYRTRRAAVHGEQLRAKGLPALPTPAAIPGRVRWRSAIESAGALLEQTATEMRDYYDDRSEPWRETVRADGLLEQIDAIERLLEDLRGLND
jgi:hypothetical protein